jgi:hypothetical protein
MGEEGKGGGEPGDLYLKVRFKNPWLLRLRDRLKQLLRLGGGPPSHGSII